MSVISLFQERSRFLRLFALILTVHGLISIGDDEYVYAAQYMKEIKYGQNNRLARQQLEGIAKRFEGEKDFCL